MTNATISMEKHASSMEQGMILLQEEFIESENHRANQSVSIDQQIREKYQLEKPPTNLFTF